MTKVILDVPTDKMHSFIKLVLKLGIEKHTISSANKEAEHEADTYVPVQRQRVDGRKRFPSFLLFDWEFFSNELEFE